MPPCLKNYFDLKGFENGLFSELSYLCKSKVSEKNSTGINPFPRELNQRRLLLITNDPDRHCQRTILSLIFS
jgi:hypothetical protein